MVTESVPEAGVVLCDFLPQWWLYGCVHFKILDEWIARVLGTFLRPALL